MVVNECIQGVLPKMDNKIAGTRNYFQPQDSNFMHRDTIKLFAGSMCHDLVSEIAQHLNQAGYKNVRPGKYVRSVFANGNIFIRLNESVRGQDVYLIQTMSDPVHDNIFEMLIMIDALKRDSAQRINVIFPYMAYGRSDKKDQPRVPITARMLANMIEVAGADRYMTIDLHSGQIQGFFNIPGDVLRAVYLLTDRIRAMNIPNLVIASTDLGFAKEGREWASLLSSRLVVVEKRRTSNDGSSEAMSLIGDVAGCNVVVVDDEVLTGGSLVNAVKILREHGAQDVYLAFTHALLAGNAVERLRQLNVKHIFTTNTVPVSEEKRLPNMDVLSVGPLLAEVIRRAHEGRSVGELFDE